jgi:hypothetical protein
VVLRNINVGAVSPATRGKMQSRHKSSAWPACAYDVWLSFLLKVAISLYPDEPCRLEVNSEVVFRGMNDDDFSPEATYAVERQLNIDIIEN